MARVAGKRGPKATTPSSTVTPKSSTTAAPFTPPAPFQYAPAALQPFLSTLPTDHVYLVHLDTTPPTLKRRVFLVPVLLNVVITALLCVRVYYAAPVYLDQIITIFGYDTAYKVDTVTTSTGDLMRTVTARTFLLMVDYAIFALLGSWPKEFVFGSKISRFVGPLDWRWEIGFQDTEIIVRRGRKWDTALVQDGDEMKKWGADEELTLKFKVEPAMHRGYTSKTGYLLLDKDWDLDFRGMLDAHRLVENNTLQLKDLENLVLVYYQNQWLIWHVDDPSSGARQVDEEQDSKIHTFKDKLTSRGLEDVFFRWIEIVQFESSQPGGFTQGRQAEAMRELKKLLTDRGVNYAKFWEEIGGQSGLPGFEIEHP